MKTLKNIVSQKSKTKKIDTKETQKGLLKLTKNAATQLKKLQISSKKNGHGLRIEVSAGGCAGFQYFLDFEKKSDASDFVFEQEGFQIFVDSVSAEFLKGTELDYVETLETSGFKFNNPNVTHSCHCGKSVC